ncbi:phosphate ABC transporter substrate-binding protein [bacterium]|nr:phosphate ABC transporter substrate-binding protein [bacterium]
MSAEPIRLVGSDLVADTLGPELKAFAAVNELRLAIELRGSRLGMETLQAGGADLALVVLGSEDTPPGPEFVNSIVGYLTTVVAVPATVPLSQIHFGQLAGVFGASEVTNIKRWSELGVTGSWGVRGITAVAVSRRGGLAVDLFRYEVLKTPDLKSTVVQFKDVASATARIGGEEGGIALLPSPPEEGGPLKVLLVAKGERDVAYGPTSENLHTGDYPLRLPVRLVFRKTDAKRLNFLIRHLLADETAPTLLKAGVVPLPVQTRNQLVFELENVR